MSNDVQRSRAGNLLVIVLVAVVVIGGVLLVLTRGDDQNATSTNAAVDGKNGTNSPLSRDTIAKATRTQLSALLARLGVQSEGEGSRRRRGGSRRRRRRRQKKGRGALNKT